MLRRAITGLLPLLAGLALAPAAFADGTAYVVYNTQDAAGAACSPFAGVPNAFVCDSVRAAVAAAAANPGADGILLPSSSTYALTQGQLTIADDVSILGQNARATALQAPLDGRALSIASGSDVLLDGITIRGGTVAPGNGGAIANAGSLALFATRVTGGIAVAGGGIANTGTLTIVESLIDGNATTQGDGGGILNLGSASQSATLDLAASTVALNTSQGQGAGISSEGSGSANHVVMSHVTLASNSTSGVNPGGLAYDSGTVDVGDSIISANAGDNTPSNCGGSGQLNDQGGNVEDVSRADCDFVNDTGAPSLATQLSDQGGQTDVLTIPATGSSAKSHGIACGSSDQRGAPTSTSSCDSGAYEQGATAPPIPALTVPVAPAPPTPAPTATPTPAPVATPVAQQSVAGQKVSGAVLVKKPGGKGFVALDPTQPIPLGSTIDVTHGTIKITALQKQGAKPETAEFFDGQFKITQTKTTTDLTLNQTLAPCRKGAHAAAAAKKPKVRKLWGNGTGSFRTRGQYSAATVRGTEWLVQDSCAGTLTRVKHGVVSVRDDVKHKTILLRAPHSYMARPKR